MKTLTELIIGMFEAAGYRVTREDALWLEFDWLPRFLKGMLVTIAIGLVCRLLIIAGVLPY